MVEILSDLNTAFLLLYLHDRKLVRNALRKYNCASPSSSSPRLGTSGRQTLIHSCICRPVNLPANKIVLRGRLSRILLTRGCSDNGLMFSVTVWAVAGFILGMT